MRTRPYRLGKRQRAVDVNRAAVIAAARAFLASRKATHGFSVQAVAQYAGIARMTIYHHFGSKAALLEALYDDLAERGRLRERLGEAFAARGLRVRMEKFVGAFCHFWEGDRLVIRRLHALSELDPAMNTASRHERRRMALRELLVSKAGRPTRSVRLPDDVIDALHTLTSFETYDALARNGRTRLRVARLLVEIALAVVRTG